MAKRPMAANNTAAIGWASGRWAYLSRPASPENRASPQKPPRPLASGQATGGAGQASAAASASTPAAPAAARRRRWPRLAAGSDAAARQSPSTTMVRTAKAEASPRDWTPRSANVAPGAPRALVGVAELAAFRLGSAAL